MSVLSRIADRVAPEADPLDGYTEAERRALVRGRGLPRRARFYKPEGPSPVVEFVGGDRRNGRALGVSHEAARLFDMAQRAGGSVCLQDLRWAGTRVVDLRDLAAELAHFALASMEERGRGPRAQTVVSIPEELRDVELVSGGWQRWSGNR